MIVQQQLMRTEETIRLQEEQLRSSEALVADFQRAIQLRDSQPQGTKVSRD